jgi:hypothetical protein
MTRQKSCGPHWGKLVHQLPGVITFAYDLHLGCTIARWKGIEKDIHLRAQSKPLAIIEVPNHAKKRRLGPQNDPRSSGTKKLLKIESCQKIFLSRLDKMGGHQDPPGSPLHGFQHILDMKCPY